MFKSYENKLQWGVLLIVVLALGAYAIYTQLINVVLIYDKYDPEMAYFMNSLGALGGYAYHFADHPGTPVNLLGTIILLLLKPLVMLYGSNNFPYYMLLHPGLFLTVARLVIAVLHITAAVYIWRFCRTRVNLPALALILTGYFVTLGFDEWNLITGWTHNAFCFSLGTVFLFITYRVLSADRPRTYTRLFWLGAGAGFLLSLQLYYVAWIIGLLAVIFFLLLLEKQSWQVFLKSEGVLVGGVVLSYFNINLPIVHRLGYMFNWFGRVTTTLGRYDLGEPGIISWPVLWWNLRLYCSNGFALLFGLIAVLMIGFVILAVRRRDLAADKVLWAMAAGLSVQALVACLLVLKNPGRIYLVSVAALIPVLLFLWFSLSQPANKWWSRCYAVLACLALVMFVRQGVNALQANAQQKDSLEARRVFMEDYLADYAAEQGKTRGELQIFTGYSIVLDRCGPLWFGNSWTADAYTDTLAHMCATEQRWDLWSGAFAVDGENIAFEDYDDWDVIILPDNIAFAAQFFDNQDVTVEAFEPYSLIMITP